MNRSIVYPGAIPLDADILSPQRNAMTALGWLLQATMGTASGVVGLPCTPTSPASMVVNIGAGAIWMLEEIDASAYGSLAADTSPLMKLGILPEAAGTNFTLTAPGTSGDSVNYLIEATFSEVDGTPVVLPYVNPANPASPYSGPANSGTAQNTVRAQTVELQLKAGAAAPTGTQITPATDTGYVPLYVITVAYGQSTVTAGNISIASGAPFNGGPFAELNGSSTQTFNMAPGSGSNGVPYSQVYEEISPATSTTITPTALKTVVIPVPSAAATITIEPGTVTGQEVVVYGNGSEAITVASSASTGSPSFMMPDGSYVSSVALVLIAGARIQLVWDNVNWRAFTTGRTVVAPAVNANEAVNTNNFPSSLTGNGWKKYPDPNSPTGYFIEQWGSTAAGGTQQQAVTFPIAFPNAALNVVAVISNSTTSIGAIAIYDLTPTLFAFAQNYTGGQTGTYSVYWTAKGY